ncbi:MAG TPA: prepilin-type N-terminal cleavage/methylation domain-containing protein [Stellaceae bacterium]|jgi:general secretion pathway protein J|nr:prepilin-type N-terminal cleavage/methylation domain-containing protein [Stellaceae bacterium]
MRRRHRSEAGFTLIELLVSITLLAVLSMLLFGGLRIAMRSGDAVAARVGNAQQIASVDDFMTNALAAAQPLKASTDADASIDFAGESDQLQFVALLPPDIGVGGFFRLRAALDGPRRRFVVTEAPWPRPGVEPIAFDSRPSVLLDGVRSIAFAYFGVPAPNQPAGWNDHWTDRDSLPQLIRLRLILADGSIAPDIVIAPRSAGSGVQ